MNEARTTSDFATDSELDLDTGTTFSVFPTWRDKVFETQNMTK